MWGPLDDVVMGGVSESGFAVVSNAGENGQPAGIFSGLVSSSNNGGFASVSPACFLLVPSSCNHVEPSSNHVDPSSDHVDLFLTTLILLLTMLILLLTILNLLLATLNQCICPMFLWVIVQLLVATLSAAVCVRCIYITQCVLQLLPWSCQKAVACRSRASVASSLMHTPVSICCAS